MRQSYSLIALLFQMLRKIDNRGKPISLAEQRLKCQHLLPLSRIKLKDSQMANEYIQSRSFFFFRFLQFTIEKSVGPGWYYMERVPTAVTSGSGEGMKCVHKPSNRSVVVLSEKLVDLLLWIDDVAICGPQEHHCCSRKVTSTARCCSFAMARTDLASVSTTSHPVKNRSQSFAICTCRIKLLKLLSCKKLDFCRSPAMSVICAGKNASPCSFS